MKGSWVSPSWLILSPSCQIEDSPCELTVDSHWHCLALSPHTPPYCLPLLKDCITQASTVDQAMAYWIALCAGDRPSVALSTATSHVTPFSASPNALAPRLHWINVCIWGKTLLTFNGIRVSHTLHQLHCALNSEALVYAVCKLADQGPN